MNEALIRELRTIEVKVRKEILRYEKDREDNPPDAGWDETYSNLLLAQTNCLNGIAVLVAARGKR